MSPFTLRRYRAERLLRQEFKGLRGRVITAVQGRLRVSGVSLDASDLEACYAQAWQGLYTAVLAGQEIANPVGWLTLVTFRRAIEEHRARGRAHRGGVNRGGIHGRDVGSAAHAPTEREVGAAGERDFAAELDDRMRLRQLFEALRGRLTARERQAAALCYLQGLSRSEAAERMGVSEARMRKLMEGQGPGRPGVAGKVGALVETIRGGGWCEEQGSLMRGLAYGILDPEGERYRLALIHCSECPACRAYVVSLRGLAVVLPIPVPVLLHLGLGAGTAASSAGAGTGAGAQVGGGLGTGAGAGTGIGTGAGAQIPSGVGGAAAGSGAAGAGAGGGWLLAGGPVAAKFAVGCVLALGVGAGCVTLTDGHDGARVPKRDPGRVRISDRRAGASAGVYGTAGASSTEGWLAGAARAKRTDASARVRAVAASTTTSAGRASREFGPEQGSAGLRSLTSAARSLPAARSTPAARSASSAGGSVPGGSPASSGGRAATRSAAGGPGAGASAAQREFGIG